MKLVKQTSYGYGHVVSGNTAIQTNIFHLHKVIDYAYELRETRNFTRFQYLVVNKQTMRKTAIQRLDMQKEGPTS